MTSAPIEPDAAAWHRRFAVDANNRAWSLAERASLTAAEAAELLHAAHTSAYHWSAIGTSQNDRLADLLLGRAYGCLGHGELAMRFASSALHKITAQAGAPWEAAMAHAVLAGAAAAADDTELHRAHWMIAKALCEGLTDPEEREIVWATFTILPVPAGLAG